MAKSLASKTGEVTYLKKGDKGDKGDIGALIYPAGEYLSTISYSRTTLSAPMVLHEEKYYVLNKEGTFIGINPKTDYAANGNKATWVLMDKVKYAFIEMLMANFAKLASAVFYGQYMFSQQGTNADGAATSDYCKFGTDAFTPNLMLDFLTGTFKGKKVEVDGGVFKNIRSPNDSFRIKESGEIEIVGKISTSLNGTRIELDPSTNSIKMYNQNGSVVGDITFVEEQWGGNINYLPMIKLTDYHNSEEFAETVLRAGSLIINDSSLGDDVYSTVLNPSTGLSFHKNGQVTKRYANT